MKISSQLSKFGNNIHADATFYMKQCISLKLKYLGISSGAVTSGVVVFTQSRHQGIIALHKMPERLANNQHLFPNRWPRSKVAANRNKDQMKSVFTGVVCKKLQRVGSHFVSRSVNLPLPMLGRRTVRTPVPLFLHLRQPQKRKRATSRTSRRAGPTGSRRSSISDGIDLPACLRQDIQVDSVDHPTCESRNSNDEAVHYARIARRREVA